MTLAVVAAVYVFATPAVNGPNEAGVPSVSDNVAGTVPVAVPGADVSTTVTPLPPNSAQLRLNRFPPVVPPVTARITRNSSCLPDEAGSPNVCVFQTAAAALLPVEVRLAVVRIGPVIESWRISIAASGEPTVRGALVPVGCTSETRNAIVSIWNR